MKDRILLAIGAVATVTIGSIYAVTVIDLDHGTRLAHEDARVVTQGRAIYEKNCAVCHGGNLEGEANWRNRSPEGLLPAPPHDESGHTWHHSDEDLFRTTKYGVRAIVGGDYQTKMPIYDGVLSDEEIIAVLSYIKSRWPPHIQTRQSALNAK